MQRMSTGDVRELAYDTLQPRMKHPLSVLRSVEAPSVGDFLRTLAVNPLIDTSDSAVLKKVVAEWRVRHAELVLAAHPSMQTKRKRSEERSDADWDNGNAVGNNNNNSARRKNNSSRSNGQSSRGGRTNRKARKTRHDSTGDTEVDLLGGKTRGNEPKIGACYQVQIPRATIPESQRTAEMVSVASTLVYSLGKCGGAAKVTEFLGKLSSTLELRDGYGAAPTSEEKGLISLAKHSGDIPKALGESLANITVGCEFAGMGREWTYAEKCDFVRALNEYGRDLAKIRREVFKTRTTSECIYMYYVYTKQQRYMHGKPEHGQIYDTGDETTQFLPKLGPERVTMAIRCLAKTAGDGFPADRRMEEAIKELRNSNNYDAHNRRRQQQRATRSGRTFAGS